MNVAQVRSSFLANRKITKTLGLNGEIGLDRRLQRCEASIQDPIRQQDPRHSSATYEQFDGAELDTERERRSTALEAGDRNRSSVSSRK